ncbi:MAG: hypothetical protein PWR03_2081, partial [Tenuifilum sp.]|uniref:O-antigen ligase family protein n=1 Tax=Tenuifilum sp. TaxID=2760880 RepID=UPI0024AB7E51
MNNYKLYVFAILVLFLEFYFTCFFGTSETVEYNVTTLIYGNSILSIYIRYISQMLTSILFIFSINNNKYKIIKNEFIFYLFILWITIVPFIVHDNFLTNFKYIFYILTIIIGINLYDHSKIKNILLINYYSFLIMGLSILIFSIIYVIKNPIPIYREYRASIMHSNANEDALILAVSFPFFFLIKNYKIKMFLILYYLYFLVFYNSTRGAIIMSILVFIFISYIKLKKNIIPYLIFSIIFISLLTPLINNYLLNDPLFQKGLIAIEEKDQGNFIGRVYGIWIPVTEYTIKNSPIFGFGAKKYGEIIDNITYVTNEYGNEIFIGRSPHNFFIMFLFNWGFIGLLLLIYIYVKFIVISYKNYKKYDDK